MRTRFRLVWLVPLAALLFFVGLIVFSLWYQYRPHPTTPDSAPRSILASSTSLRLVSRLEICADGIADNPMLAIDHQVIYMHSDGTPMGPYIRLHNVFDTAPVWQSHGTRYPYSMAVLGDNLILSSSLDVWAYGLDSGELRWRSEVLPGHARNVISLDPALGLTIHYTEDTPPQMRAVMLQIEPQTGSLLEKLVYPIPAYALMAPYTNEGVLWVSGEDMWLSPTPTDPPVWRVQTGGQIAGWPIQSSDLFLVSSGLFPKILAIDSATGNVIWQDEREFASTLAMFHGLAYAITKDAALVALEPDTGHQAGSIEFSPQATEASTRSHVYAVVASSDILAAYFGDSCELFVFELPAA